MSIGKPPLIFALITGIFFGFVNQTTRADAVPLEPHRFSFAVVSDIQGKDKDWQNALLEIRDMTVNDPPVFAPVELILAPGDGVGRTKLIEECAAVFKDAKIKPIFVPVVGNHDRAQDVSKVLSLSAPQAVRRHPESCDYFLDHKNIRFIVIDAYSDFGKDGVINDAGRKWVEQAIKETPASIDHIFISFHEPAFPRLAHRTDSFDEDPELRNAFWRMLVSHRDRVRAVFCGHTHAYERMRVSDPAGKPANDYKAFPDEPDGIYHIVAGSASAGKEVGPDRIKWNTIVQVQIEGKNVSFRALQTERDKGNPFKQVDQWSIERP